MFDKGHEEGVSGWEENGAPFVLGGGGASLGS